jgi:methyl-accepting chemotaxis protein
LPTSFIFRAVECTAVSRPPPSSETEYSETAPRTTSSAVIPANTIKSFRETADKIARSRQSGIDAESEGERLKLGLGNIPGLSDRLNQLVAEIAGSCRRQTAGFAEIDRALGQIKTAVDSTSGQAEQSAHSSAQPNAEAGRLNALADRLAVAIRGGRRSC